MFSLTRNLAKYASTRQYCKKATKIKSSSDVSTQNTKSKLYGQPTHETHPHLINKGEITPLITKAEFQTRRHRFIEQIVKFSKARTKDNKKHIVVIPAASKQYMSDKIPYVFRQNTEFLYLTGCQEPDCCLVISVGDSVDTSTTTFFTRDKDAHSELWDGPRTYPEDATEFFGVNQSLPISDLEKFLTSFHKSNKNIALWYDFLNPIQTFTHKVVTEHFHNSCESPKLFIDSLRLFKSQAEIALMQKSCEIASAAIIDTIAASKPGISENEIFATVDYQCRRRGAEILAYPPVVAGGSRATVIHYINNNQIVKPNELVLMDAGCEYHGYSSDITRTWPISGKFTKEQREIYEIVFDAQKRLIEFCADFPSLDSLFEKMCLLLGKNLQNAKLLETQASDNYLMKAAYKFCPHHVSHYLGMDVHDTPQIPRNIKIQPGMIITVEPGIYISSNSGLPPEYHGIGVRIEDDVLITENGPVVLTQTCPKHPIEIEALASKNV